MILFIGIYRYFDQKKNIRNLSRAWVVCAVNPRPDSRAVGVTWQCSDRQPLFYSSENLNQLKLNKVKVNEVGVLAMSN